MWSKEKRAIENSTSPQKTDKIHVFRLSGTYPQCAGDGFGAVHWADVLFSPDHSDPAEPAALFNPPSRILPPV